MIEQSEVTTKVRDFVKREFPEIWEDIKVTDCMEEFANILFEMLVGEFQEEEE